MILIARFYKNNILNLYLKSYINLTIILMKKYQKYIKIFKKERLKIILIKKRKIKNKIN